MSIFSALPHLTHTAHLLRTVLASTIPETNSSPTSSAIPMVSCSPDGLPCKTAGKSKVLNIRADWWSTTPLFDASPSTPHRRRVQPATSSRRTHPTSSCTGSSRRMSPQTRSRKSWKASSRACTSSSSAPGWEGRTTCRTQRERPLVLPVRTTSTSSLTPMASSSSATTRASSKATAGPSSLPMSSSLRACARRW